LALYKGGEKTNPSNYRPELLLLAYSKIIGRYLYNRIVHFLDHFEMITFSLDLANVTLPIMVVVQA